MTFALLGAVAGALFAIVVLRRFARSRRPAFAAWGLGLLIFAVAAGAQAWGEVSGFNELSFRIFYLFGGVLGVAFLALGTVFLLAPGRVAWTVAAVLALIAVATAFDAFTVPVNTAKLATPAGVLGEAVDRGTLLHLAAVVLNIVGSLVLIGGSAWSAWKIRGNRTAVDRFVCNLLLTAGAFVIAAGFSATKVAGGRLDTLGAYEALGITVMFCGFLALGRVRFAASKRVTPPAAA